MGYNMEDQRWGLSGAAAGIVHSDRDICDRADIRPRDGSRKLGAVYEGGRAWAAVPTHYAAGGEAAAAQVQGEASRGVHPPHGWRQA